MWVVIYISLHHICPYFLDVPSQKKKKKECFMQVLCWIFFMHYFVHFYNNPVMNGCYHYLHFTEGKTDTQTNIYKLPRYCGIGGGRWWNVSYVYGGCFLIHLLWQLVKKKYEIKDIIVFLLPQFQWAKLLKLTSKVGKNV